MSMDAQTPNYRREFFQSPHHAVLGLLTLGAGFLSAHVLGLIAGVTAYLLGWIYLPDLPVFRRWVERRRQNAERLGEAQKLAEFQQRREALLRSLSYPRRERYAALARVCRDIENATADNPLAAADPATDPRLRKLDELMWTLLRLLGIEESLERFLETERTENVPQMLREAETEAARLTAEAEALKQQGNPAALERKQRYLNSRLERLEVLRKRQQRIQQAEENLALVVSEQDRLDQQIKLIRADAVATRNAESLTARIDATVEHLDQTNKWLSQLDEFKDLVGDLPATEQRVGYEATVSAPPAAPPPLPAASKPVRSAARQRHSS
jgi:DNA repair exonuclease SbcCD ATPase subunit